MRSHILAVCLLLGYLSLLPAALAEDNTGAIRVVERLHQSLIEAMKSPENYTTRYNLLFPVITELFDTKMISRVILSRHWRSLEETQQKTFIDRFNDLSASTYASRFNHYGGESFTTIGQQELKKDRVVVKTEMQSPDSEPVRFDYILHEKEGNWYIISVIANGVNDLSLKRAEYGTMIENEGFDALIAALDNKITSLRSEE